ncbi:hypothetical protein MMC17_001100 [Xylographa soralifera]|nr:hypothetical protein [Xylographa soralifera]
MRLTLQAFVNGSVQEGIDHISTLQSFRAVIIGFSSLHDAYSEHTEELIKIPMKLLPQAAANDPEIELEAQQISFQLTLLIILKQSGCYERVNHLVEESLQFADEHEVELDELYILRIKGALLNILSSPHQLKIQSDESKRLLLVRLEAFHKNCQSAVGESHSVTVGALLCIAVMHRDFAEYERANQILNHLIILCQKSPDTLAYTYGTCLIQRTGLALKTNNLIEELEAFHDAIWNIVGLTLAYKYAGDGKEIDALWDGVAEYMQLEETPGVGIGDFIYAFEVAAEGSKRSAYQEASNIMQSQVDRLRDLKMQVIRSVRLSKSALLILLKGFWTVVDSIGPFASPAEPRPTASYHRHNQGLGSPSLWSKPRIFNIEGGQAEEQESRRQLGQNIITKIRSSPSHAKPYFLFMCIHSLELYYYGEKNQESAPLDARSIDLYQRCQPSSLAKHIFSLCLSNVTIRREESEACIMQYRFKDIATPGNRISLSASTVVERLNSEYKKRGWYPLCKRLYEITFQK